jgi:DNA-binding Lrp family transcriptional regulator
MTISANTPTTDETDEALLRLLRADARMPAAELARRLGLSRTTVQSRLERLERNGIVEGYTVRLGDRARAGWIRAQVLLTILPKAAARAEAGLSRIPQITALHSVSGQYDMIAAVETISVEQMDRVLDEIGAVEGVERTVSSIILKTKFLR